MFVYRITNVVNGWVYIGSTKDFDARKKQHLEDLFNKKHHNYKLQRDYDKYGPDMFKFDILQAFSTQKDMLIHEYQLINSISKKKYNIRKKDYTREGMQRLDKNQRVHVQRTGGIIITLRRPKKGGSKKTANKKAIKKVLNFISGGGNTKLVRKYKRNGEFIVPNVKDKFIEAVDELRKTKKQRRREAWLKRNQENVDTPPAPTE
jgi:group I intron endonuclease